MVVVFTTPTECGVCLPAVLALCLVALFVYRDMGPLKGKTMDERLKDRRTLVLALNRYGLWWVSSPGMRKSCLFFNLGRTAKTLLGGDRAVWGAIIVACIGNPFYVYKLRKQWTIPSVIHGLACWPTVWVVTFLNDATWFSFPIVVSVNESRKVARGNKITTIMSDVYHR